MSVNAIGELFFDDPFADPSDGSSAVSRCPSLSATAVVDDARRRLDDLIAEAEAVFDDYEAESLGGELTPTAKELREAVLNAVRRSAPRSGDDSARYTVEVLDPKAGDLTSLLPGDKRVLLRYDLHHLDAEQRERDARLSDLAHVGGHRDARRQPVWTERTRTTYTVKRAATAAARAAHRADPTTTTGVTVIETTAVMKRGTTATGKSWCRWQNDGAAILTLSEYGYWAARTVNRHKGVTRWSYDERFSGVGGDAGVAGSAVDGAAPRHAPLASEGRYPTFHAGTDLREIATAILGEPATLRQAYPLAEYYALLTGSPGLQGATPGPFLGADGQPLPTHSVGRTTPHLTELLGRGEFKACFRGAADAQALTRNLFGSTRYRRDLVKEVAQAWPSDLSVAWQFRGLVPIDWIVTYLRGRRTERASQKPPRPGWELWEQSCPGAPVRQHLLGLSQRSLRRLLNPTMERDQIRLMADLAKWSAAPVGDVRTWRELHDRTAAHIAARPELINGKKRKLRTARLPIEAKALEGTTAGGLRVEVARKEADLIAWGLAMSHCIGTYGNVMASGAQWLGAIWDTTGGEDVLVANFSMTVGRHSSWKRVAGTPGVPVLPELSVDAIAEKDPLPDPLHGRLDQLLGKHNRTLDRALLDDIEAHFRAHDVIVPDKYWGSGRE